MRKLLSVAIVSALALGSAAPALSQSSEVEALREELRRLQQRLERLERAPAPTPVPAAPAAPAPAPPVVMQPPAPGDREIRLERENILETIGLPKPEIGGVKFSGFFVGSASYNSHAQLLPEFAGGAPALSDPGSLNFRFDKFGFGVAKTFASWLSASAAIEIESHRDRHSHLITATEATRRGCPAGVASARRAGSTPCPGSTVRSSPASCSGH